MNIYLPYQPIYKAALQFTAGFRYIKTRMFPFLS